MNKGTENEKEQHLSDDLPGWFRDQIKRAACPEVGDHHEAIYLN